MRTFARTLPAAIAGAIALSAMALPLPALAQTMPPGAPRPSTTVNLTAEHRHVIKEIIIKEMKVEAPAQSQAQVPTEIGAVVPQGVPLQPIPVEVSAKIPALKAHSFVVKDGVVLIVDPKDNRIAEKVE